MRNWLGLDRPALWIARKILVSLARARVLPDPLPALPQGATVCYVLESRSLAAFLMLDHVCIERSLPRPSAPMTALGEPRSVVMLRERRPRRRRTGPTISRLGRLVLAARENPALDVQLVPMSIFWGRAPDRQHSLFKLLFSESWAVTGPLFRLVSILLHGRDTLVEFGQPVPLRDYARPDLEPGRGSRRLHRLLRVHFRNRRVAVIGPDLSHRRTLVSAVVRSASVRAAVRRHAR